MDSRFVTNYTEASFLSTIQANLRECKSFCFSVSFIKKAGLVLKTNKIIGRILLIPGVIGFLSIMNTFSHLHISLGVSVLRTVYGVILGFIVGFIFIGIYKLIVKFSSRLAKRWS